MRVRISSLDPRFPGRLRYPGGPDHVEAEGPLADSLERLRCPIAIVGTRKPSAEARTYTFWLAKTLAEAGATIVSGGAYGIDTAAHEGALAANQPTVAVLPTSVDAFSPAGNSALFRRIRATGALVGFRQKGDLPRFHERNAAIAALVNDVIVTAAPVRSGARNTAAEARRREHCTLWVVPGAPWDPTMAGCAIELTLGAEALISPQPIMRKRDLPQEGVSTHNVVATRRAWQSRVTTSEAPASVVTIARDARDTREARDAREAPRQRLTTETLLPAPEERRLLHALAEGPGTVDDLVLRTALPVAPVRALLLTWTVEGVVREGPVGLFRLLNS